MEKDKVKKIKMAVMLNGGLGTYVMELNYLQCLYSKFGDSLLVDVFATNSNSVNRGLMEGQPFINEYFLRDEYSSEGYDLCIDINWFVKVSYFDETKIKRISESFYTLLEKWINFQNSERTRHMVGNNNMFDPNIYQYALVLGKNRLNITDIDEVLGVKSEYIYRMKCLLDENTVLNDFNLSNRTYITMQSGVNAASNTLTSPRQWPIEHYEALVKLLKAKYPEIVLIQLGEADNNLPIAGVDVNLLGKTEFEELKVILKNSLLHIDGDCGMLHMRKTLGGGPSVALWGQTPVEILGYGDDINIIANTCPSWCGKLYTGWKQRCYLYDTPKCMYDILPEKVFEKMENYIDDGKIEKVVKLPALQSFVCKNGIVLDDEWVKEWLSKRDIFAFDLQDIRLSELEATRLTPEGYVRCRLDEMPQYKYLKGDNAAYKEYMALNDLYNEGHEHSEAKYQSLLEELKAGIDISRVIVIDGTDRILDGVHRATYIAAKNGFDTTVRVLKLYGDWMFDL
ncbi:ADP-heptose:LPS heptosyltransferase [Pseudobutyrivibrio ruminis]|uniref:ADP-heptose:LPS heptosyltransferase n=1 Tax=Pseudobutyrivibrio ruminis TaxID=46206 RepID=A0A1H7F813_9FIRM|nr:glycosyltransferase family 9 protein [Pseudobutyrivibrio ruminis]SEK21874.1 ADP-heptose:LPS heptosyltransferase [Pseudobutyrivibrio ruminis]